MPATHDAGTTRALAFLLDRNYFADLHNKLPGNPTWRRNLAFASDFLIKWIVYLAIIAIIVGVAYKTLAPFPHPWK